MINVTGFQEEKRIKYLGIQITNKTSTLIKDNYMNLFKEIQKDLEKWDELQLSLMGRRAVIKINVLPKLIFLFQSMPMLLKQTLLQEFSRKIMKFVWQGKKPRIKMKALQDSKQRVGFGLLNFQK